MKNIFALMALVLIFIVSSGEAKSARDSSAHHGHNDMKSMDKNNHESPSHDVDPKTAASIKEIVGHYLQLKNALVDDDSKNAAAAGKEIVSALEKLDKNSITAGQKKLYEDVEEDAMENAEHIGDNAGKIEHQREHFDMLSIDMYDLVKEFGSGQVLYKDYCPMYNDKKGAIWLSETKEIKNPYYGKKMLTCGSVKEEIK